MFREIYTFLRGAAIADLIEEERFGTLYFLHHYVGLDAVYASSSHGSLSERVERFLILQNQGYDSPEEKFEFMRGLLVPNRLEPNVLYEALISCPSKDRFITLFEELTRSKCFDLSYKDDVVSLFLRAIFEQNSSGKSVFLDTLVDIESFNYLIEVFEFLDCFKREHHREAIREVISQNESGLMQIAMQELDSYQNVKKLINKTGYKDSNMEPLLNTSYECDFLACPVYFTPVESVLFFLNPLNIKDSWALLRQMKRDGAILTQKQTDKMTETLIARQFHQPRLRDHWKYVEACVKFFQIKNVEPSNRSVLKERNPSLALQSKIEPEKSKKASVPEKSKQLSTDFYAFQKFSIFVVEEANDEEEIKRYKSCGDIDEREQGETPPILTRSASW